jgi:hypothetical protein
MLLTLTDLRLISKDRNIATLLAEMEAIDARQPWAQSLAASLGRAKPRQPVPGFVSDAASFYGPVAPRVGDVGFIAKSTEPAGLSFVNFHISCLTCEQFRLCRCTQRLPT